MIVFSSAFSQAQIAIDINGKQDFCTLPSSTKQAESIMATLDQMLAKNKLSLSDNDAYGIVVGPGSFTGLRVGAAIVKGLCAGSKKDCKVVAISSLALLAEEYIVKYSPKTDFTCILNALSGYYYACKFSPDGKASAEQLLTAQGLQSLVGTTVGLEGEGLAQAEVCLTPQVLLAKANQMLRDGQTVDKKTFAPVYIRKSQAEVELEQKQKSKP